VKEIPLARRIILFAQKSIQRERNLMLRMAKAIRQEPTSFRQAQRKIRHKRGANRQKRKSFRRQEDTIRRQVPCVRQRKAIFLLPNRVFLPPNPGSPLRNPRCLLPNPVPPRRNRASLPPKSRRLPPNGVTLRRNSHGKVEGEHISFNLGGTRYSGRVNGEAMEGTAGAAKAAWSATRVRSK
jgi:hypothetical protein